MRSITLTLIACFCAGLANAKEGEPSAATSPEPAPAANAPAPTSAKPAPSANAPAAPTPRAANKPRAEGVSSKAYGRLLAAEIRRRTPKVSHHPGSVEVSFTVGATGKVTSHKIVRASDPALSKVVTNLLASIQAPPPPGGSFVANQEFTFH